MRQKNKLLKKNDELVAVYEASLLDKAITALKDKEKNKDLDKLAEQILEWEDIKTKQKAEFDEERHPKEYDRIWGCKSVCPEGI